MEDLSKAIYLLDNITENMEWIKLLLEKDRFIAPLTTHDLIMKRLEQVKEIVKSNYIDNKPRKTDFTTIETPTSIGTPTEYNTFTGDKPFDRDSVGGEELHETS